MELCTCLNCSNVFVDTNPQTDSIDYPFELNEDVSMELIDHECPICKCDDYLVDNVNPNAGGEAERIFNKYNLDN